MPQWVPGLLLFVFATHLPFFAWKYYQTRELRFAATSVTFALLVISYSLRIFAPGWAWSGHPMYSLTRVVAWCFAALSIGLLVRHHVRRIASQRSRAS